MKMAVQVVTLSQHLNNELHLELQKISNIPQDINTVNITFIYVACLGLYIFRRKNPNLRLPEELEKFDPILKDAFAFATSNIAYGSQDDKIKKIITNNIETNGQFEAAIEVFSEHRGDIAEIFADILRSAFNGSEGNENRTSKIKFFPEEYINDMIKKYSKKWWLKRQGLNSQEWIMQVAKEKLGAEYIFYDSVLFKLAQGIVNVFEEDEAI